MQSLENRMWPDVRPLIYEYDANYDVKTIFEMKPVTVAKKGDE